MNVTVMGAGYVGLVGAACFAEKGWKVLCVDVDEAKINLLMDGKVTICEPGLQAMVRKNIISGHLGFSTDLRKGIAFGDILVIAVGAPLDDCGNTSIDNVLMVAQEIGRHMTSFKLVVNKSTVPMGTIDKIRSVIQTELAERCSDLRVGVVSNPEFLQEGNAVNDFMEPDRIVIGGADAETEGMLRALYAPFETNGERLIMMDARSAELTKYAANAMLATRISFMNEIANLAEATGADIDSIRLGIGGDRRIGKHFLYAGTGYGGSCLPKDVVTLVNLGERAGVPMRIISAVNDTNSERVSLLIAKMRAELGGDLRGKTVAMWGLSFKANTGDMRDAPSMQFIEQLLALGATICAYDPEAMETAKKIYSKRPGISFAAGPMEALRGADGLMIVTEWRVFAAADLDDIKRQLGNPLIVDGRNVYDPQQVRAAGLTYISVGRS